MPPGTWHSSWNASFLVIRRLLRGCKFFRVEYRVYSSFNLGCLPEVIFKTLLIRSLVRPLDRNSAIKVRDRRGATGVKRPNRGPDAVFSLCFGRFLGSFQPTARFWHSASRRNENYPKPAWIMPLRTNACGNACSLVTFIPVSKWHSRCYQLWKQCQVCTNWGISIRGKESNERAVRSPRTARKRDRGIAFARL